MRIDTDELARLQGELEKQHNILLQEARDETYPEELRNLFTRLAREAHAVPFDAILHELENHVIYTVGRRLIGGTYYLYYEEATARTREAARIKVAEKYPDVNPMEFEVANRRYSWEPRPDYLDSNLFYEERKKHDDPTE